MRERTEPIPLIRKCLQTGTLLHSQFFQHVNAFAHAYACMIYFNNNEIHPHIRKYTFNQILKHHFHCSMFVYIFMWSNVTVALVLPILTLIPSPISVSPPLSFANNLSFFKAFPKSIYYFISNLSLSH